MSTTTPVRIGAVAAHFGRDLERALVKVEAIVADARAAGVQLLVFPDASLGGYLSDLRHPDPLMLPPSLREDGPQLRRLMAAAGDMVVAIGYAEEGAPAPDATDSPDVPLYNAAVCLHGDGVLGRHRKVHQPAGESLVYAAGDTFEAFDSPVGRLGMLIDYDKTFPEAARSLALQGAQILLCLSAWPASITDRASRLPQDRQSRLFDLYDQARAAENQVFWVSANQTGSTGGLRFLGQAKIVGPGGEVLARTSAKGGLAVAEVHVGAELARSRRVLHHLAELRADAYPGLPRQVDVWVDDVTLRIALLTYSTKPRGGVVHTLALAEALAAAGQHVQVWTLSRGGDRTFFRPVDPRVQVHAVPFEDRGEAVGPRILRSIATLREAFAPHRDGLDVVHAQDCISANAALPCVRTIHHLDTFTTPELAACHERAIVAASARICVSASVAREVHEGWGLQPEVIGNGVDAARFAAAAADLPARHQWAGELGRYVLALGGIEPRKGSIELLEAYALLRRRMDVQLVFGGGETLFDYRDYRAAFDQRAHQLDVQPRLLGVVDDARLPALVAQAAALAFVSTQEGFGLAAMEALAAGVPVVGRRLPVLQEVFGDTLTYGHDAASIADALEQVLTAAPDPRPGQALAAASTWHRAALAHLDFYRRLLA